MEQNKIDIAYKSLKMISKIGDRLSQIGCSAGVYTLDDDEYGDICFIRDLADEALRKMGED